MDPLASASLVGRADPVALDRLKSNPRLSEEQKLHEVSRQFEAVLLRQILAAARKTVIKSDSDSESSTSEIYQDMINTQLAESISASGSFGLARSLELQLRTQTHGERPSSDS